MGRKCPVIELSLFTYTFKRNLKTRHAKRDMKMKAHAHLLVEGGYVLSFISLTQHASE